MNRIILKAGIGCLIFIFAAICLISLSAPAYCAEAGNAIARLTSFSGTVLIKSKGEWGVQPEEGMSLYSDDKIVTRMGIATITFDDGAVMDIKANSNLLIRDTEEAGIGREIRAVKRQLRLLVGKMLFRTGRGTNTNTTLETTTMVCGLRGTSGTLSIDAAGVTYLFFTEGGGDTVGNFISGIAPDVPMELADLNEAQRAAFVAVAAAEQAKAAAEKLIRGEITDRDAQLAAAEAAKAAAQEAKAAAEAILDNPDESVREEARAVIALADKVIKAVEDIIDAFMNGGDDDAVFGQAYGVLGDYLTRLVYNLALHGNESDIILSGDLVPPVIDVTGYPVAFSNSVSPAFTFTTDEYVTYYYILDGGARVRVGASEAGEASFELSGLTEGSHTLELIVMDAYGNETSQSFSWITDLTAPVVSLTASPGDTTTLVALLTNSEPGEVTYLFTDAATGKVIPPYGFEDGSYSVNVTATDQAGNSSTTTFTFTLANVALEGSVVGSGSVFSGTSSGTASVVTGEAWGGWTTDMSGSWYGTHTGTFSLVSGEYNADTEYLDRSAWISLTSGTLGSGTLSGNTEFIMLDHTSITRGTGVFSGTYTGTGEGTWTGTDIGAGLTNTPLDMAGYWESWYPYHYTTQDPYAGSSGLAGVTANGDDYDYVLMGYYYIPSVSEPYITMNTVWDYDVDNTSETSALAGTIWEGGQIKGLLAATYDEDETDSAGIFYEELSGEYYEGIIGPYTNTGMWLLQGTITPVEMLSGITSSGKYIDYDNYPDSYSLYFTDFYGEGNVRLESGYYPNGSGNGVSISSIVKNTGDESIDMVFGAWSLGLVSGHYSYLPSDGWSLLLNDDYEQSKTFDTVAYMLVGGTGDSTWDDSTNEISASVAGSWADLTDLTTGLYGGGLIGTFDATDSIWQAVAAGSLLDTETFLELAGTTDGRAKLTQLDIPCIEVGSVTLTGGYNPGGYVAWDVTMNDVKFFAYSTGAVPRIWATGDVTGTITDSAYLAGYEATLAGGSFSEVGFYMSEYSQGTGWVADVEGYGYVDDYYIRMMGNAAGTDAGSTAFSGTASGIVEEQIP